MAEEKLSDSYHRARRMFALFCGILIVWEYVGIEVGGKPADSSQSRDTTTQVDTAVLSDSQVLFETAVDAIPQRTETTTALLASQPLDTPDTGELAVTSDSSEVSGGRKQGGATGTMPLVGIPVTFRNPEVIPAVIFILVLYFGFRFTIEWRQCPESIRAQRTTKVDAAAAYAIGIAAVLLFAIQRATEFRFAEFFGDEGMRFFYVGFLIACFNGTIIQPLIEDGKIKRSTGFIIIPATSFGVYGMIAVFFDKGPSVFSDFIPSIVGIVLGSVFMMVLGYLFPPGLYHKLTKRKSVKAVVEKAEKS